MKLVIGQEMFFRNDYGGPLITGVIDIINRNREYKYSVIWRDGIRNSYRYKEIILFIKRYDPYFTDFFDKIKERLPCIQINV